MRNIYIDATQGARGVNLTWNAVKGCLVSTCLGHSPEHFLGGQLCRYAARNKWRPFFKMAAIQTLM